MRVFLPALALASALTTAVPAYAQSQSDDRFPSFHNGMRGREVVKEWRWVVASWYGPGFHGRRTASGERFNSGGLTAAHKRMPFGSRVRFEHHGRSVVCRITDRGPFIKGREFDLSAGCARAIGMTGVKKITAARV